MNDTEITVVGTVLTMPELRQTEKTNAVVTSFRIISNSRRFDRQTGQWTDGPSFWVRVHCWRRLAEHVKASLVTGDPVIVRGRITTRAWESDQGDKRLAYELEATAVGHDLTRGTSTFAKARSDTYGAVVDDAESESRINGEPSQLLSSLPEADAMTVADEDEFTFNQYAAGTAIAGGGIAGDGADADAASILREAGLDPRTPDDDETEDEGEADLVGAAAGSGGSNGRGRRRGR
jgi:single-strand DNA-binding protein